MSVDHRHASPVRGVNKTVDKRHNPRKATLRSAAVIGLGRTSLSFHWILSHKCSVGFKSELRAGRGMILMLCSWRHSLVALAVWARALSCSVGAGIVLQCGRGHCPAVWARALSSSVGAGIVLQCGRGHCPAGE